jgi:Tol biopolymer transport system component
MRTIFNLLGSAYAVLLLTFGGFLLLDRVIRRDEPARPASDRPSRSSQNPSQTPDGRFIAFQSSADYLVSEDDYHHLDIFLEDRVQKTIHLVSTGSDSRASNGDSVAPSISDDGRYVAFRSTATNLVPGDTNGFSDIFVKDMRTGAITLVSADSAGKPANGSSSQPTISPDGRLVTFRSSATNLVVGDTNDRPRLFVRDLATRTTTRTSDVGTR